jgi:hypothetical protein
MAGGHMRAKANKADRECGMRGHEEKQMVDPIAARALTGQKGDGSAVWCIVLAPPCPFFWLSKYNCWTASAPQRVSREEEWERMEPTLKKRTS